MQRGFFLLIFISLSVYSTDKIIILNLNNQIYSNETIVSTIEKFKEYNNTKTEIFVENIGKYERGKISSSLSGEKYNLKKLLCLLKSYDPKIIIAVDLEPAKVLNDLRIMGELQETNFFWIQTDSSITYSADISKNLDHTFVFSSKTKKRLINEGVYPDKVSLITRLKLPLVGKRLMKKIFYMPDKKNEILNNLGLENGSTVEKGKEALKNLDLDFPADIEIILAYAASEKNTLINQFSHNPAGHIAIRIGDIVYSTNGKAKKGKGGMLLHKTNLYDYLFGVRRTYENQQMESSVGLSYLRENISIRVSGISKEQITDMINETNIIEEEWKSGQNEYSFVNNNCADFVLRILESAGLSTHYSRAYNPMKLLANKYSFPLDVFKRYVDYFRRNDQYETEIVFYSKVPDSKQELSKTRFPLSLTMLSRSLLNILSYAVGQRYIDPLEKEITKQIKIYYHDARVNYENINGESKCKKIFGLFQPVRKQELWKIK